MRTAICPAVKYRSAGPAAAAIVTCVPLTLATRPSTRNRSRSAPQLGEYSTCRQIADSGHATRPASKTWQSLAFQLYCRSRAARRTDAAFPVGDELGVGPVPAVDRHADDALGWRGQKQRPQPVVTRRRDREVAWRTLARPPEKTEKREFQDGVKTTGWRGWRSRGQARKPRQHWGKQEKKPTENGWFSKYWWPSAELNHGHADFQSAALPTELLGQRCREYIESVPCRQRKKGTIT
jgi:hypothetical protein